jgi:DNA-directed RNA polymerase subunit RPC12/RpoP
MSACEVKTFEWKCDHCGQKIMSQGISAEKSRPEEFGVQWITVHGEGQKVRVLDVCTNCWDNVSQDERLVVPTILEMRQLRAS